MNIIFKPIKYFHTMIQTIHGGW